MKLIYMEYLNNNLENYASYMNDEDLYETFKNQLNNTDNFSNKYEGFSNENNLSLEKKMYKDKFIDGIRNNLILNCGCSIDEGDKMLNSVVGNNDNYKDEIEILSDEIDKKCVLNNLNNLKNYFSSKKNNLLDESNNLNTKIVEEDKDIDIETEIDAKNNIIENPNSIMILEEDKNKDNFLNIICLIVFLLILIFIIRFVN